jgi:hypothetical protein
LTQITNYQGGEDAINYAQGFSFIYKLGFGENDIFAEDIPLNWATWGIYMLSTIYLPIMNLNLLISIIGDSYEKSMAVARATDAK